MIAMIEATFEWTTFQGVLYAVLMAAWAWHAGRMFRRNNRKE